MFDNRAQHLSDQLSSIAKNIEYKKGKRNSEYVHKCGLKCVNSGSERMKYIFVSTTHDGSALGDLRSVCVSKAQKQSSNETEENKTNEYKQIITQIRSQA